MEALALHLDAGSDVRQSLEALARQDLPPQLVANNLAYLRTASQGGTASGGAGRSWNAVGSAQ